MYDVFVFSRNRAMQLSLLLSSLQKNTSSIKDKWVLYKADDENFQRGYDILKGEFPEIYWVKEFDFKKNTYYILDNLSEYFSFAVDDNILYKEFNISNDELDMLFNDNNVACLSLRLGLNCTVQYNYTGEKSVFPRNIYKARRFLIWDQRSGGRGNFFYKWSVDQHIMRLSTFVDVLKLIDFNGPNAMEGHLSQKMGYGPPNMACLERSVVCNTPLNRVNTAATNRAGEKYGISEYKLNELFLQGKRPQLDKMCFDQINGCHIELPLVIE